jgi:catechol 2,3-dioxygenase-like lactoylglutathione lyase family enzyme
MTDSTPVLGMSHVAICVRNLDESLKFYRDLVGLQVVRDDLQDTSMMKLNGVYRDHHAQRRVANLQGGPRSNLPRLVISEHPGDAISGNPIMLDEVGISHFSFTVPSLDELVQRFSAQGLKPCGPQITGRRGTTNVFFRDPDGILVQFDEGPKGVGE